MTRPSRMLWRYSFPVISMGVDALDVGDLPGRLRAAVVESPPSEPRRRRFGQGPSEIDDLETRPIRATETDHSSLEHDLEKACPRRDRGRVRIFGKDHCASELNMVAALGCKPVQRCATAAQPLLRP